MINTVSSNADLSQPLAMVPDLISLIDVSTGENIGVQEYRYEYLQDW